VASSSGSITTDFERLEQAAALSAPAKAKRMLIIVNPYATTMSDRLKHLVVYALQGRYEVEAVDTQRSGHATELCREAASEGYDVVVAFGGDGTVNEAANGIAGSETPLTCLPGGATNVYCRMLGIPNDVVDATEHLLRAADAWQPRRLDLGSVNGRHFLFSAGYGLDAAVVRRVDAHPAAKARFRHWYYATAGLATFAREYVVHPPQIDLEVGGETVRGVTALVQTGDPYTYFSGQPLHVAENIALDDGTIAGALLLRSRPYDVPTVLARLFSTRRRVSKHRRVFEWHGRTHATCVSADGRPVPLQVDGDYIGDTVEARYEVLPGALTVLS
jgi:diacylglycerol kinase family enzyme